MAALGPSNVVARRVVDDLLEFSGETSVSNVLSFFNANKLLNVAILEDRRNENDKLLGLNDLIAQALKEIQAKKAHVDAANNSG
ncbi:hypothetical protein Tco_1447282 [Tanacetum coccineum]